MIFLAVAESLGGVGTTQAEMSQANWAIWTLFQYQTNESAGNTWLTGKLGGSSLAQQLYDFFVGQSAFTSKGTLSGLGTAFGVNWSTLFNQLSSVVVYTPIAGTQNGGPPGTNPQEFFGYNTPTPEPTSLLLMGTGLVAVAGALKKRITR